MSRKKYICYFLISLVINCALLLSMKISYSGRKTISVVPATGILEAVKNNSRNKEEKETAFSYRENPSKTKEEGEIQKYRPQEEPEINTHPENKTQQKKHAQVKDNANLKLPFPGDKAKQNKEKYPSREQYMEFIKTETKPFTDKRFLKTAPLSVQFSDSLENIKKIVGYFNFQIVGYSPNNLHFLIVGDKKLQFKKIEGEKEIADFYRQNTNRTIENMPTSFLELAKQEIERDMPGVNSEDLHLCFLLDASSAAYFSYKQDLAMKHIGITEQASINRMNASFIPAEGEDYYILKIEDITLKSGVTYHLEEDPELSRLKTL